MEQDVRASGRTGPAARNERGAPLEKGGPFSEDWRMAGVLLAVALVGMAVLPGPWIMLHPVLMGAVMVRLWWRRGRDPGDRRSVTPRYEPPDGLSPAEVGILVDHTLDMRDVTASLADLAHRGYLDIEEASATAEPSQRTPGTDGRDYVFVRTSDPEDWDEELGSHEGDLLYALFGEESLRGEDLSGISGQDVLSALRQAGDDDAADVDLDREEMSKSQMFRHLIRGEAEAGQFARAFYGEGRERIRMSELEDSFYIFVGILHNDFLDRLDHRGYYHGRPGGRRGIYVLAGLGVTVLMWFFGGGPLSILAGILSGLVVGGVAWIMPARTRKGARALSQARGFEEFLDRVEEDRFRRMIDSPEDFEARLPYAVALGVDDKWADAFASLYSEPDEETESETGRVDYSHLREDFREEAERHDVDQV